ncbi:hypothetical protein [Hydrocarboniphaga sp.]|uniref:hypothetical protein n=1 Tax=Hydrocarboniphaga sp. TaxID=2033016 RepID=UPI003D10088F
MKRAAAGFATLLMFSGVASAATRIAMSIGRVEGAGLPTPLRDISASCVLVGEGAGLRCGDGILALNGNASGAVAGAFEAHVDSKAGWTVSASVDAPQIDLAAISALLQPKFAALKPQLSGTARVHAELAGSSDASWTGSYVATVSAMNFSESTSRYATEKLDLQSHGRFAWKSGVGELDFDIASASGQAYVEPVFVDIAKAPLHASLHAQFDISANSLLPTAMRAITLQAQQRGVFDQFALHGAVSGSPAQPLFSGDVQLQQAHLDQALPLYAAPFLAGGRWQNLEGNGLIDASVQVLANRPSALTIELKDIGVKAGTPSLQADGLSGALHWSAVPTNRVSTLSWRGLQYGDLPIAAASVSAIAQAHDFEVLQSPRLPILGGALVVDTLQLRNIGRDDLFARFAATIEPIDLAALCKALSWPQFGGEISGRIPGVAIRDKELIFEGRLSVTAFDGDISIEDLRVQEVFGRLPRLLANLRLRNLDLKAVTQAFSFGRIEGRLSGDVEQLRLLSWRPVAFDARLYTPPDDHSRHRISQRAIDNLSSLGGGPTGVLQRGVLRFFEDFAYDRVGVSCKLDNGVCAMDGIEAAKNGGYVLVKGRLLPRIDVIGYERRVDWERFVAQLLSIRGAQGVEVR